MQRRPSRTWTLRDLDPVREALVRELADVLFRLELDEDRRERSRDLERRR